MPPQTPPSLVNKRRRYHGLRADLCKKARAELVPDDMVAIPIGPDQQHIVVASPAYLHASPPVITPEDLAMHECIQLRMASGSIYRWEFQRRGQDVVVPTTGNLVVDQSRLLLTAALRKLRPFIHDAVAGGGSSW